MMLLRCLTVSIVGMLTLLLAAPAAAQPVKLASESYHVPARDPGIQLYVRNKRPEAMTTFTRASWARSTPICCAVSASRSA